MNTQMDIQKLREMILRPCENAFRVPYTTREYADVLKWWSFYKQGNRSKDILLDNIFSFRKQSSDHAILYSSSEIPGSVLLLGKVNGAYININLKMDMKHKSSFVAVYV